MPRIIMRKHLKTILITAIMLISMASVASAAEFWLRAEAFDKTMPDSAIVKMWGFAQCTDGTFTTCAAPTVPGPELVIPPADTTLTIHLINNLSGPFVEPVSLIIPGQIASLSPVKFFDAAGRQRVQSFTTETPADNTTVVDYMWTNVRPGTYLYQSGTHPAVQVQMGLYGAVKKDVASGEAYPGVLYNSEVTLLYSEIDPVIHGHVANGTYGTPPPTGITSSINYEPKYFLINGAPYSAASFPIPAGNANSNILVRFLNAGLETHVPIINGLYMRLIAEDGNTYPFSKQQYSLMLPAGKTIDALITPAVYGSYAVYDRSLFLTNGPALPGGMLAYLQVGTALTPWNIGIFYLASWYLDMNSNGIWEGMPSDLFYADFGAIPGARPVTGDWNRNGLTEIGVFVNGAWYIDYNGNGAWDGTPTDTLVTFDAGIPGATPVTGDWNGDGATDIGVFDNGAWYLDMNGNRSWDGTPTDILVTFDAGILGATPVTGDWTGNGATDIGVFYNGTWYLDMNGNRAWDGAPTDTFYGDFGIAGSIPVTGDWNGNGTTEIGIYYNGTWYLDMNGNGAWDGTPTDTFYGDFGIAGSIPVSGKW